MKQLIFDYNFRISWSSFIILSPIETGVNTPQSDVIYLRKCSMRSSIARHESLLTLLHYNRGYENVPLYLRL